MFLSRQKALSKKPSLLPSCPNVLTPDRIPKFFIPPQLSTVHSRAPGRRSGAQHSPQGTRSPEVCRAQIGAGIRHIFQTEHLNQDPVARRRGEITWQLPTACSSSHLASPGSLPLLPESPHTRRRESLFHTASPPHWISLDLSPESNTRFLFPELWCQRPLSQPDAFDSDMASSAGSSPFGSPLLVRLPDLQAHNSQTLCSCTLVVQAAGRACSLSTEEASSTDDSPSFSRREPSWGAGARLAPPLFFPLDFTGRPAQVTQENTVALSPCGRLRLTSDYVPASWRLRVQLISAEGIYPRSCDPRHLGCCVSVQLRPGKAQKQRSAVVKRSRSPIFNEDFFFEGLAPHELPGCCLRFKVLSKGCGMRRDALLGKAKVPLPDLLPS
uniref:C2 calcium dependent domain containing 4D n=1 Tax=Pelusios castaneus TaxID=367368 RepID=A0A8C8VHR4_9SAUR